MKDLGNAFAAYTIENGGAFPTADAPGGDTRENAAKPEAKDAWYNVLPWMMGRKTVGDYASVPREFYSKDSVLYVRKATYPSLRERARRPYFAIAFNAKLQRKDAADRNEKTKLGDITRPERTVLFFERGLPGEQRLMKNQSIDNYDGSCKGSAKSFVGRHNGTGVITFVDGHVAEFHVNEILTETGDVPFLKESPVIWMRTPEENSNTVGR